MHSFNTAYFGVGFALWRCCLKNARKYIPVGLGRAILGAPRFWEALPAPTCLTVCQPLS